MRIGTRGSQLALWQAQAVARLLTERTGTACEIVTIRTTGDELSARAPDPAAQSAKSAARAPSAQSPAQSKRGFVKEIEDALLDGRVDIAVHSAKDMSAAPPDGLMVGAALPREDPRDAMVLPAGADPAGDLMALVRRLGATPRIGTSSIRRAAQLARVMPGALFEAVRGNVDTRLRKLDGGTCDVLVLAAAGLRRLGFAARISLELPVEVCTPAPGQGIVAVQIRTDDAAARAAAAAIDDADARDALAAEQALVRTLGGGCYLPVGALARLDGDRLSIDGIVAAPDGSRAVRHAVHGHRTEAAALGDATARALLAAGAAEILRGL